MADGIKGKYPSNKYDGVYTGETRTITKPDIASIPPNEPRPEEVAPTSFVLGKGHPAPAGAGS